MFRSIEMVIASEREAYAQKIFEDLNVHRPQAHHPLNQPKNPQTSSYISPESVRRWSLSTRWLTHNRCSRIMHGRRNINYVLKVSFFQRSQHTRGAELITRVWKIVIGTIAAVHRRATRCAAWTLYAFNQLAASFSHSCEAHRRHLQPELFVLLFLGKRAPLSGRPVSND